MNETAEVANGRDHYLYYNGHGDLAAEADGSGTRTALHTYDPFGAPLDTPPANQTVHRYTGEFAKQYDTASSLILMGARPYDPSLGRFLAVDPVAGGSLNNYDYAAQDPVNGYDLSGAMLDADATSSGADAGTLLQILYEECDVCGDSSPGNGIAQKIERAAKAALKGCASGAAVGLVVGAIGADETGYGALAAAGGGCARGAGVALAGQAAEASGVPHAKFAVDAVDWVTTGRDLFGAVGTRLGKEGIQVGWGIGVEKTPNGARFFFGLVVAKVR